MYLKKPRHRCSELLHEQQKFIFFLNYKDDENKNRKKNILRNKNPLLLCMSLYFDTESSQPKFLLRHHREILR